MSACDQVPLEENPNPFDKTVPDGGGLDREEWEMVKEKWGEIAKELHRMPIFLNNHQQYENELLADVPEELTNIYGSNAGSRNNGYIDLREIRYGQISNVASQKPSLWVILTHREGDPKDHIHYRSLFSAELGIYHLKNGRWQSKHKVLKGVPIQTMKVAKHDSNTYVLLAIIPEPDEFNRQKDIFQGRLGEGEKFVMHLQESRVNQYPHLCATWKTTL